VTAVPALIPLRKPVKKYTVVIDPGHGGEDPGAVDYGVKEKNITLQVAEELKRQMEEAGRYKVVLTRDRDVYIKLRERVGISRRVEGDLFISIHADKIGRKGVRGASVYTLSEMASDAETARLAEAENNSGFVAGVDLGQESQDVADILLDLAMREKMNESNLFARMLHNAFLQKDVRLLPKSHRSAGFAVLKAPDVPSALVEIGFLSNPEEAKLLSSGQFQSKIAASLLDGADAYFRKIQALQTH
jgi:N-acetylmuramoyl-L-alanine amidase